MLSLFRLAAIVQGVYYRGLQGNTPTKDALALGSQCRDRATVAWELVQKRQVDMRFRRPALHRQGIQRWIFKKSQRACASRKAPLRALSGSIILVEIEAGRLTRIEASGKKQIIAETGGGPDGAAFGPDGRISVCNNGGMRFVEKDDMLFPAPMNDDASTKAGSMRSISKAGKSKRFTAIKMSRVDGAQRHRLRFKWRILVHGSWQMRRSTIDRGAVYSAAAPTAPPSRRTSAPLDWPRRHRPLADEPELYVAETHPGRVWAFQIDKPGTITRIDGPAPWTPGCLLAIPEGYCLLDSLTVDAKGNMCVGSIPNAIQVISQDGSAHAASRCGSVSDQYLFWPFGAVPRVYHAIGLWPAGVDAVARRRKPSGVRRLVVRVAVRFSGRQTSKVIGDGYRTK